MSNANTWQTALLAYTFQYPQPDRMMSNLDQLAVEAKRKRIFQYPQPDRMMSNSRRAAGALTEEDFQYPQPDRMMSNRTSSSSLTVTGITFSIRNRIE